MRFGRLHTRYIIPGLSSPFAQSEFYTSASSFRRPENRVGRRRRFCVRHIFPQHKVNSRRRTIPAESNHAAGHRAIQNGKRGATRAGVDAGKRAASGASIAHYAAGLYVRFLQIMRR